MASNPSRRPFDFGGNHLVLDFVNTVSGRPVFTRDDLIDADDVVAWADAAGLRIAAEPVVSEMVQNDMQPSRESRATQFRSAISLRENLYRVFGPIADGGAPHPQALAFVAQRAARAMRSAHWSGGVAGFEPQWPGDSIDEICDRLADDAVQLLRSPAIARVGSCAGCGWLFLDTSRAHARRWCSMNACGVRDKMRRYHQRQADVPSVGST